MVKLKTLVRPPGPRILDPAKVKARREQLRLTAGEAARRAAMPRPHYSRVESGRRRDPRLSTAVAIAAALSVALDDLLSASVTKGIRAREV